jgi:hypothetical protein
MIVHLIFIFVIFIPSEQKDMIFTSSSIIGLGINLLAFFISHGYSFLSNYVLSGEWKEAKVHDLLFQPYARIIAMHIIIIFGAFIIFYVGEKAVLVIALIALKTGADIVFHLQERKKFKKNIMSSTLVRS